MGLQNQAELQFGWWALLHWSLLRRPLILSLFFKFIFKWRIITLQCCVGFCYTAMWTSCWVYMNHLPREPPSSHPSESPIFPSFSPPADLLAFFCLIIKHSKLTLQQASCTCVHAQETLVLILPQMPLPPRLVTWEMSPHQGGDLKGWCSLPLPQWLSTSSCITASGLWLHLSLWD